MMPFEHVLKDLNPFVRYVKIDKSSFLSGRWMDYDNVFTIIASGRANFILDGRSYDVVEGDVIIMKPGLVHIIRSDEKQPFMEYIFHFDLHAQNSIDFPRHEIINRQRDGFGSGHAANEEEMALSALPMVIRPDNSTKILMKTIFINLHKEFIEKKPGFDIMLRCHAMELLVHTFRASSKEIAATKDGNIKSWGNLRMIVEIIQVQYQRPELSVKTVADIVGLTPNYISTLFKTNLGITIYEYLTFVRIEAAKNMLFEGSLNITQIAETCGFSSIYSFSRAFRRVTGLGPSQFSKNTCINIKK